MRRALAHSGVRSRHPRLGRASQLRGKQMSIEPTETSDVSTSTPLPSPFKPPSPSKPRMTAFRLVMLTLLLIALGFALSVWHTSREIDQFIKTLRVIAQTDCNQAQLHAGATDAALLKRRCNESVDLYVRDSKDRVAASIDMEVERNRATMKHVLDKQDVEPKPK